jgi:hypothetical protein
MKPRCARDAKSLPSVALALGMSVALLALAPDNPARATASSSAEQMISIDPLTKYTLPDQTASVMLPQGWHVTHTGIAFIRAEGPQGELGFFGLVVPVHDAPANGAPTAGAALSQPYAADTADKIQQSINWVRAMNGQSAVQVSVVSQQAFTAPPEFGQCSRVLMTLGVQNMGTLSSEADFCSLPTDSAGYYRNFMKIVAAPPAVVASQRATLETMLASYMLNMKAVQAQLARRAGTAAPSQDSAADSAGSAQSQGSPQSSASQSSGSAAPTAQTSSNQKSAQQSQKMAQASPVNRNSSPQTGVGSPYQSLQQKINAEIAQGGFSPQMVAAMRAQATAQANAAMAPTINRMRSVDQSVNYFDRSVLRGQIPVAVTHAGTMWIDPN